MWWTTLSLTTSEPALPPQALALCVSSRAQPRDWKPSLALLLVSGKVQIAFALLLKLAWVPTKNFPSPENPDQNFFKPWEWDKKQNIKISYPPVCILFFFTHLVAFYDACLLGSSSGYHSYSLYPQGRKVYTHIFLTHRLLGLSTNATPKLLGKANHSYSLWLALKKNIPSSLHWIKLRKKIVLDKRTVAFSNDIWWHELLL